MPILDAQGLVRSYGARSVLSGVSLTLDEGDRVGLVGVNGSGKSTLARILAGIEEPDAGAVIARRGARIEYLAQDAPDAKGRSAHEQVLSGLGLWSAARARHREASDAIARGEDAARWSHLQAEAAEEVERHGGWDVEAAARAMLDRLGIRDADREVSAMSGGERRRVDLARLLVARPDVLILDEPTNHLDIDAIEWLEEHLRGLARGALFVITHDRAFLDRVVTRTAELERGALTMYAGGYAAYLEGKAEREAFEDRRERNRQNLLRRELDWLRRSPSARTTKQKARIQRAESVIAEKAPTGSRSVALLVDTARSGKSVLDLEHVGVAVPGRTLVEDLTTTIVPGERLGIVGPNGCGKTTLLRTMLGELEPSAGTVRRGANVKITYFGQHREGLDEDKTVLDNVAEGRGRVTIGERTMDARGYLERFLFDADQMSQPVSVLSGGERARALLAKLLLMETNLLAMDEPTNDLDTPTLAALEEMLVELDGTALIVTHDRWFLDRVATGILAFEDGRVVKYAGGYTDYRAQRAHAEAAHMPAKEKPTSVAAPAPSPTKKKGLTYAERLELEGMMDAIGEAETTVADLEAKLADPDLYRERAHEAPALSGALDAAKRELERKMTRWEELEEKKAAT
ncbi:MAG: ABC-F family ATP-binding cassette domain-containing protein [Sandaracinaceae bacterium]